MLLIKSASQEQAEWIDNQIVAFNKGHVPFAQDPTPIFKNYVVEDQGKVIAGINAFIYHWKILYIDVLFVAQDYRGQHLGQRLLSQVEEEAKAMGVTLSHLDTFDFQAKDFYLKQGYEVFGVLEDCPPGHQRFYLKKDLREA